MSPGHRPAAPADPTAGTVTPLVVLGDAAGAVCADGTCAVPVDHLSAGADQGEPGADRPTS